MSLSQGNNNKGTNPAIYGNNEVKNDLEKVPVFSGAYKCKKCGESKTLSLELETRFPDIPKQTFIRCTVCGNAWKI